MIFNWESYYCPPGGTFGGRSRCFNCHNASGLPQAFFGWPPGTFEAPIGRKPTACPLSALDNVVIWILTEADSD